MLSINITSRLSEHAERPANRVVTHDNAPPPGYHHITLSIVDTIGKTASRTFNLSVAH